MKKTIITVSMFAMFCVLSLSAQSDNRAGVILSHYSPRTFATGTIPRADLELIVQTGVRAPSAANRQPWHFTVVQNLGMAQRIVPQSVEGNVLIIISAAGDGRTNTREIIDCALATQSIYLAAQALGYGSRIYTGPIDNFNRTLKNEVGLPRDHNAIAIVRVGRVEAATDATSAASARNATASTVTYK
jgi:nitroreductase